MSLDIGKYRFNNHFRSENKKITKLTEIEFIAKKEMISHLQNLLEHAEVLIRTWMKW